MTTPATRASLIELDLPTTTPAAAPDIEEIKRQVGAASAKPAPDSWAQPVKAESRALALDEKAVAERHGFNVDRDQLYFDEGTELIQAGHDKLAREARKFAKLPALADAAAAHCAVIAAEARRTSEVQLAGWRLDIDGKLRGVEAAPGRGLRFTSSAVSIADHAIKQAAGYATTDTGPNPNTWLGSIPGTNRLRARTRTDGKREAFAVQGPESKRGYVEFDSDAVITEAARQLAHLGLKADVRYSEESTRMSARLFVQAPIDIPAFTGVGRVHQAGVLLRCADNGSLSIQADSFIIRVRCLNATLVRAKGGKKTRVRHVGNVSRIGEELVAALDQVSEVIPELTSLWQRAAVEHYVDKASGTQIGMQDAFERLVSAGHLPKGGLGVAGAVEAYMSAWRAEESPANAMGVIMAAQRAAHETTWRSQWAEDEVNEAASALLYQPVYTLDSVEA